VVAQVHGFRGAQLSLAADHHDQHREGDGRAPHDDERKANIREADVCGSCRHSVTDVLGDPASLRLDPIEGDALTYRHVQRHGSFAATIPAEVAHDHRAAVGAAHRAQSTETVAREIGRVRVRNRANLEACGVIVGVIPLRQDYLAPYSLLVLHRRHNRTSR